jgi:hypothetical protein
MNNEIVNLKISYDDVLVRMGANKYRTKIDSKIETTILETIDLAKKLLQPKYAVSLATKKINGTEIFLDDFSINSKDIFKLLENSNLVCGLIATIGFSIDTKISFFLEQKEIMPAFILDSVGSVAIEELVENICNDISEKYGTTTMRFSPGYGDWHIQNQKDFLKWLGAEKIGITLSPSFQMIPRKSVSALLGINKR